MTDTQFHHIRALLWFIIALLAEVLHQPFLAVIAMGFTVLNLFLSVTSDREDLQR